MSLLIKTLIDTNRLFKLVLLFAITLSSCKNKSNREDDNVQCNSTEFKQAAEIYNKVENLFKKVKYDSAYTELVRYGLFLDSIKPKIDEECFLINKLKFHTDNIFVAYRTLNVDLGRFHIEESKRYLNSKQIKSSFKIRNLIITGSFLNITNNDSAFVFLNKAEKIAFENNDTASIFKVGLAFSLNYIEKGKSRKCINKIEQILPFCQSDEFKPNLYNMLGASYENLDQNKKALNNYLKCISFAKKNNDLYTQKMALHNVSIIESKLNLFDEALAHADSCILYAEKSNIYDLRLFYQNKAQILSRGYGKHKEAFEYLLKAKQKESEQFQYLLLNDFSDVYQKLEMNDLALSSLTKCVKECIKYKDHEALCVTYIGLGKLYEKLNQNELAYSTLIKAKKINIEHLQRTSFFIENYVLLEKLSLKTSNHKKAYKWSNLKDSIQKDVDSINYNNNILLSLKENQNKELAELNEILSEDKSKALALNSIYLKSLLALIVLIVIISGAVFMLTVKNKQKSKELTNKFNEIEKLNNQLSIAKKGLDSNHKKINTLKENINIDVNKTDLTAYLKKNDWINYAKYFEDSYPNFLTQLKLNHPELNQNDLKLCSLIKLNFTNKEIANLLNITDNGMKKARQRLKTKLSLKKSTDINDFLMAF